jgi:hypothetical protein
MCEEIDVQWIIGGQLKLSFEGGERITSGECTTPSMNCVDLDARSEIWKAASCDPPRLADVREIPRRCDDSAVQIDSRQPPTEYLAEYLSRYTFDSGEKRIMGADAFNACFHGARVRRRPAITRFFFSDDENLRRQHAVRL